MNYETHFKRAEETFGKLDGFLEADVGEKCVILLRKNGYNYGQIQL